MHIGLALAMLVLSHIVLCIEHNVSLTKTTPCETGFFLDAAGNCRKHLTCQEMQSDLKFLRELPGGYVKKMSLVKWGSMELVYSTPRTPLYDDDFEHGMRMMGSLQGNKHLLQVIGLCYEPKQVRGGLVINALRIPS